MNSSGQAAYEMDLLDRPTYHDGTPRKAWDQLSEIARWSWNRGLIEVTEHPLSDFEHVTL